MEIGGSMISVIIPAYNEEKTIGAIVRAARTHPLVAEVIVVDDGSQDRTGEIAERCGASVVYLFENVGKATAMDIGVDQAHGRYICFLDADLHCLTHQVLYDIIRPVTTGQADMFVAIRGRRWLWLNRLLRVTPIIGGERCLRKSIWQAVPERFKKNFQIEIALNYVTKKSDRKMNFRIIQGLRHTTKFKKRGLFPGSISQIKMFVDIIQISMILYLGSSLGPHLSRPQEQ